ncbi:MAG TPA: tetratricopeptide repeat protein [Candidatus Acidoferrum sp.]
MRAYRLLAIAMVWPVAGFVLAATPQTAPLDTAKQAFEKGDYAKAVDIMKAAESKDPQNGDVQLLLTKSYLELNQHDAAVSSGEKAVAINPKSSVYHQWLGEAYGAKASHASMFSAYPLARKTQKEFETAVQLDEKNFDAAQDLVEYDCTAPGVVGGGEDKAQPIIQKLMTLDPSQGHYAAGNCRQAKKDYAAADAEFTKALESKPKSAELIYNIGDYFRQRGQADQLAKVADLGEAAAPGDPRGMYNRAVSLILKGENLAEADKLLREYLRVAPPKSSYPKAWHVHYWLGQMFEKQKNVAAARSEYEAALKLNSKYKTAQEALKKLGN